MNIKKKANEYEENWDFDKVCLSQAFEDGAKYALQALKEEVEKLDKDDQFDGMVVWKEDVLNLITNLEDNG